MNDFEIEIDSLCLQYKYKEAVDCLGVYSDWLKERSQSEDYDFGRYIRFLYDKKYIPRLVNYDVDNITTFDFGDEIQMWQFKKNKDCKLLSRFGHMQTNTPIGTIMCVYGLSKSGLDLYLQGSAAGG